MKRWPIIILSLFSLTCQQDNVLVDGGSEPAINLEIHNLKPLLPGEGHYEAWVSFSRNGLIKVAGVQNSDSSFVSFGGFNVDAGGHLMGLDGSSFSPRFTKTRDLQYMSDAIITIEPDGKTDGIHGPVIIGGVVTGDLRVATVELSTAYGDAIGNDFDAVTGHFILATPTSADTADSASGIWFMNSLSPQSAGFVGLPQLGAGWKYEGWVRTCCIGTRGNGTYLNYSTGTFVSATGFDSDSAGARGGPLGSGYPFPGEDYTGIKRILLDNGMYEAMITIEPDPDNSTGPFEQLVLFGPAPISPAFSPGQPQAMQNNAASFPAGKIKIIR